MVHCATRKHLGIRLTHFLLLAHASINSITLTPTELQNRTIVTPCFFLQWDFIPAAARDAMLHEHGHTPFILRPSISHEATALPPALARISSLAPNASCLGELCPLKRCGEANEVGDAIGFLLTAE
jgi:hypothetical protein